MRNFVAHEVGEILGNDLQSAALTAQWGYLVFARGAHHQNALTNEVQHVVSATNELIKLVAAAAVVAAHVTIGLYLSVGFATITVVGGVLLVLLTRPLEARARRAGTDLSESEREAFAISQNNFDQVKIAKSFGIERLQIARFLDANRRRTAARKALIQIQTHVTIAHVVGASTILCAVAILSLRVLNVSALDLILLVVIFSRILPSVAAMQLSWVTLCYDLPCVGSVICNYRMLVDHRDLVPSWGGGTLKLRRSLVVNKVDFTYPGAAIPTLSAISLEIPANRITAIAGHSGAGKSTLADIIIGLLMPDRGSILLDGKPLKGNGLECWRRSIGYVPQEIQLSYGTIRDNLRLADANAEDDRIWVALGDAAMSDVVARWPDGLSTLIGDRGLTLSGGEKQRLALARALLREPTLLLLDEPTSALDAENEQRIRNALERLRDRCTIVVVAHRVTTIQCADLIVVMENGRIIEQGTWEELAGSPHRLIQLMAKGVPVARSLANV